MKFKQNKVLNTREYKEKTHTYTIHSREYEIIVKYIGHV